LVVFDVGFFLLRIYFVPPFSAFYCEGIICRIGLENTTLMAFLNTVIVTHFPCILSVLVSLHQAVVGASNKWTLPRSKQNILTAIIIAILVLNIIGFVFLAKDSDDA
ncbi:hypothetical protein PFISCL1PPCAC_3385, partial [Pristionchus fissidentatus]